MGGCPIEVFRHKRVLACYPVISRARLDKDCKSKLSGGCKSQLGGRSEENGTDIQECVAVVGRDELSL